MKNSPQDRTAPEARLQQLLIEASDILSADDKPYTDSVTVMLGLAMAMRGLDESSRSQALYSAVLAVQPDHRGAHLGLVDSARSERQFEQALGYVDAALSHFPSDKDLLQRKSSILQLCGRLRDAEAILAELVQELSGRLDLRLSLAQVQMKSSDFAAAELNFSKILEVDPSNRGALLGKIDVALRLDDPGFALLRCDQAREIIGNDHVLLERRAQALIRVGRPLDAIAAIKTDFDDTKPHTPLVFMLANAYSACGDHKAAEETFDKVLRVDPGNRNALVGRIDSTLALGDPDAALQRCEEALKRLPDDQIINRKWAAAKLRAGHAEEAVKILQTLAKTNANETPVHLQLARAKMAEKDFVAADKIFKDILDNEPHNQAALLGRVDIALATGKEKDGVELIKASLSTGLKKNEHTAS